MLMPPTNSDSAAVHSISTLMIMKIRSSCCLSPFSSPNLKFLHAVVAAAEGPSRTRPWAFLMRWRRSPSQGRRRMYTESSLREWRNGGLEGRRGHLRCAGPQVQGPGPETSAGLCLSTPMTSQRCPDTRTGQPAKGRRRPQEFPRRSRSADHGHPPPLAQVVLIDEAPDGHGHAGYMAQGAVVGTQHRHALLLMPGIGPTCFQSKSSPSVPAADMKKALSSSSCWSGTSRAPLGARLLLGRRLRVLEPR